MSGPHPPFIEKDWNFSAIQGLPITRKTIKNRGRSPAKNPSTLSTRSTIRSLFSNIFRTVPQTLRPLSFTAYCSSTFYTLAIVPFTFLFLYPKLSFLYNLHYIRTEGSGSITVLFIFNQFFSKSSQNVYQRCVFLKFLYIFSRNWLEL